ncbi:MAG TPA: type VI secretion system membrane subunit TssM [Stellaceae bacterium]
MKRVLGVVTAKWFVTLIGAIALSLIVWFIGPLIAVADIRPLDGELARIIVVMLILVGWGLINIFSRVKDAQTNAKMAAALTEAPKDAAAAETAEEIAQMRKRLEEALALLKKGTAAKGRGGHLYQLPWYMLIGPPGSGKTTALQNSGLNFPLAAKYGKDPVKGVGGTRNCDWWLTDEAVLLDTAGRYTTQDSHAASDQAAWKGFLGLLKKFRPRQPINGALVAISIADIIGLSSGERLAHARAIRQRLRELSEEFGIRFPVYVLLTKADLIAGFVEFFDDLGREDREQVWGMTLAMDRGGEEEAPAVVGFASSFDALVQRLNERQLERIQNESDLNKRALIYGFPAQVASIKELVQEFLNEIFMPNRYEGRPLLRGLYFTSGTQEGTPIDRIMAGVAATFGLDRQRLSAFSGAGRGYFLTRLLRGVVFAEASVAGADTRVERRQMWLRQGAFAAAGAVFVGALVAWTVSYFANRSLIADIDAQLAQYAQAAAPVAVPQVTDSDIASVLPSLKLLRAMPAGYDARSQSAPWSQSFGLYQGDKLGSQEVLAYRRALNTVFLPRLLVRLGDQIRGNLANPDYVNEALKTYLMLGSAGPLDKDLVRAWMDLDWQAMFPGPDKEALRGELAAHLNALLEAPLQPIALDGSVIDGARRTLLQSPLAGRAYSAMKRSPAARKLQDWRIAANAGPAADRVFVRNSGKLLSDGVPGFYTYEGYYKVFLPGLGSVARDMARESWVLGDAAPKGSEASISSSLQRDIAQLYVNDYIAQWDGLLSDIAVAPFRGMQNAAEAVNILSSPTSPLKLLLVAVAKETKLSRAPDIAGAAGDKAAAAVQDATNAASAAANRLAGVVGQTAVPAVPTYGQAIEDHFRRLHEFVGLGGQGPAPVDDLIRGLNDVYLQLNRMGQPGQDLGKLDSGAVQKLTTDATRLPPPLTTLVAGIARNASTATIGGARVQINDDWQAKVLPFCQRALDNRYPIVRGSPTDVTLDDFAKLFAPNGLIDSFFKTNLRPFVDTSQRVWRWQKVDNIELGIPQEVLTQFQRAAAIRDGFFAGGAAASVKFELLPLSLDADVTQVLIDINGQEATYAHGPPRLTPVQWPGSGGAERGRIAFSASGQPSSLTKSGPWSLFRLFDEAKIQPTGLPDRLQVTFSVGGHSAAYEVRANSVNNPLTMTELHDFRCPARL